MRPRGGARPHRRRLRAALLALGGLVALLAVVVAVVSGPAGPADTAPGAQQPAAGADPGTRYGASFQVRAGETYHEALDRTDATLGGLDVVRVYYPGAPAPWPGKVPGRASVVSFKLPPREVLAGAHDDAMRAWFAAAPTDVDTWWVPWHEPEDEIEAGRFTAAEFRRAVVHLSRLADEAGNPSLHATLVLMSYTLDEASGRNWRDYYPRRDAVDVLAWDVYNRVGSPCGYCPPEELFAGPIAVSRKVGKPFGIAELGSARAPGDDSGAGRAAWLRDAGRYLAAREPRFVIWFDFLWNGGEDDYRLVDRPSVEAWREVSRRGGDG